MSLLGLLFVLLVLALLFGGYGSSREWGYYGWSPLAIILVVVLILLLAGTVHAEQVAPMGLGLGLFGVVRPARIVDDQAGPPGLPYVVSYWLAVLAMVVQAGLAYVTVEYASGHGASLGITPQAFSLMAVAAVMIGALQGVLPNVQHTPHFRTRELLRAHGGLLPRDLRRLAPGGEPPK